MKSMFDNTIKYKNTQNYLQVHHPRCVYVLKEGSGVCQKHSCLGILFIAAIVTTCFGRACWCRAQMRKKHNCMSGSFATAVWVGEVRCGWGSSVEGFYGLRMWSSSEPARHTIVIFSHLCTASTLWPADDPARPKHVVAIAAINTITRQLYFWRTLLPCFNT
jgi:hypothetical protein